MPKRGGSYVEQAGILARAVNQFLYCGIDGICRNAPIDFAQSAYATYAIGQEESLWEPSQGSEIPVEELTVAGVTYDLIDPNLGDVFVTVEYVSEGEINPSAFNPNRQVIGERKAVTTFGYNPSTKEQRVTTLVERPVITIEPPPTGSSVGYDATLLVDVSFVEEIEKFDSEGKLGTRTVTTKEPQRIINPADTTRNLRESKVEITSYTYTSDKLVAQIEAVVREAAARVNPEAIDKLQLVFSEDSRKTWAETPIGSGIWFNTERYRVAQRRAATPPSGSSVGYNPYFPVSDPNKDDIQQRGTDLKPPAVEYRNPDRNQKERQIKAVVNTPPLAGSSFRPRKRTINVEGCTSQQQLYDYGVLFNRLLTGRRFGRRIGFRISDAWLSAAIKPLMRVDAIFNGATYKLLLDGLTWSYAQNEAFVVGNGILIGSQWGATRPARGNSYNRCSVW
ncbi:MAG: hypothetical protein HC935_10350 [Pseudanabaena sp. SU_2_4]|nr:hypothetical protein [Pseudanabaena sp. SU_2_4]